MIWVVPLEAKNLDGSDGARRLAHAEMTVVSLGDTTITREVMAPGWRWSNDVKPIVGTDFCRAPHQLYIVSGRLHVVMEDGAELEVRTGDAVIIPPGHDAWVVGDAPCDAIDFSPTYVHLIEAGQAFRELTEPAASGDGLSRGEAAARLRASARAGELDASAVELVLGAVGHRPSRSQTRPDGLTPRELEVLVLIATGASTKQVAYILGVAHKTAATHIERIYAKTGVSSRSEATLFAIRHGLVDPLVPAGR